MEEILTGADFSAAADAGAAQAPSAADTSPAQDGSSAGEMLYEKYQAGASVETLNEMIAQEEPPSKKDGDTSPEVAGAEADGDAEAKTQKDSRRESAQKKGERTFTQRDVDYLIGKKTSEVTRKHSALLDDLSALLGVERDKVTDAIRRQRLENEAEKKGVEDKELYVRTVELEEQNRRIMSERQSEQNQRNFMELVKRQVEKAEKSVPGFDMSAAVDNQQFVDLLQVLTGNPQIREHAVEMAYRAIFADDIASAAAKAERERVVSSVKAGHTRISEGAANSGAGAASKMDVSKMTDAQIAELAARAAAGEKIVL